MRLTTTVFIPALKNPISYHSNILSVGSCFAVNMSEKLNQFQFQHSVNPLGILFHPLAIEKLIDFAITDKVFDSHDIFLHQGVWSCFDAHSDTNTLEEADILFLLNTKISRFKEAIKKATHFVITLGTAWVYRHIESNLIVANCHKLPQKLFTKELLTVNEITASLHHICQKAKALNPDLQFIYTVSPVRHIKDGFVENQQSKAHLIAGLHQFLSEVNHDRYYYFPAYEILMDELRDYRFYANDLLHPNETALQYIWEKFVENSITPDSYTIMKKVEDIQKGLAHRPFNPYSKAHEVFLEQLAQKLDELLEMFPFMNFRKV